MKDYLRSLNASDRPRVLGEIDELIARAPDEPRMLLALENLHSGYEPDGNAVDWMRALRAAIAQQIGH